MQNKIGTDTWKCVGPLKIFSFAGTLDVEVKNKGYHHRMVFPKALKNKEKFN